jgi:hypothetical protein
MDYFKQELPVGNAVSKFLVGDRHAVVFLTLLGLNLDFVIFSKIGDFLNNPGAYLGVDETLLNAFLVHGHKVLAQLFDVGYGMFLPSRND